MNRFEHNYCNRTDKSPSHNFKKQANRSYSHKSEPTQQATPTTDSNIITELQPFFLTKQMVVKKSKSIKPLQRDSLFWCYYILKNGHSSYEQISSYENIPYVKEKQMKIQIVEKLRDSLERNKLKQIKLCSIDHIENQLANENTIDLSTFFSLCFVDNIQVFYFKGKCYYTSLPEKYSWMSNEPFEENKMKTRECDETSFESIYHPDGNGEEDDDYDFSTIHILKQTSGKYWMEETNISDIDWEKCYRIKNIAKPINAVSAYTAPQIKEMASMFGLEISGKKKQEIYDQLKSFIKIDII